MAEKQEDNLQQPDNNDDNDTDNNKDDNDNNKDDNDDELGISDVMDLLRRMGMDQETPPQVLSELSLKGVAEFIASDKCQNIIVMTGAGISTAAGIPDFRSPGTGLYSQLEKYNLPHPQAIFELDYYKENPEPFCMLAKEMWPGNYNPTISHHFLCLLEKKGLLLRSFTQNIDGLELVGGLPEEKLVAAHGSFHTSHCIDCQQLHQLEWIKEKIFAGEVPRCTKEGCGALVKPDIVFFGEALPERFFKAMEDFKKADLLIVMGTSLKVQPFNLLVDQVAKTVPRLLINREKVGDGMLGMFGHGFDFDSERKYRDVAHLDDCDSGCVALCEMLGWKDELLQMSKSHNGGTAS